MVDDDDHHLGSTASRCPLRPQRQGEGVRPARTPDDEPVNSADRMLDGLGNHQGCRTQFTSCHQRVQPHPARLP